MKKNTSFTLLFAAFLLISCSKESPELLPCMCDGSESTLGLFDCMCEPMKKKPVRRISYIQDQRSQQTLIINPEQRDAYIYLHQRRDTFAPIKLEYVDFRIRKGRKYDEFDTKLGNYRFRIFGCRRESKNVFLNQGRAMQKDMHFFDIFFEQMNDYYPVVVEKNNPYYLESDRIETPEYILTAEIDDYFMNICDEFDWDNVKQKKIRSGSSEMTVTWRVMNLTREEVYCRGVTTGYGQISEGEPNGETLLVERAFEDALNKVPEIECFNRTLAQRIRPEDLQYQLAKLRDVEARAKSFQDQYATELKGVNLLQECATGISSTGGSSQSGSFEKGGVSQAGAYEKGGVSQAGIYEKGGTSQLAVSESYGTDGSGRYVRGRFKDGKFVEDPTGSIIGHYDEKGTFIEDRFITGVSCINGHEIRGRYADGRFIEDASGTITGYYDEKGTFIPNSYIEETSGIVGDGFCDEGQEPLFITDLSVDERSGSQGKGSYIDGRGGAEGAGSAIRYRRVRNAKLAGLSIDQRCRAIEINDASCTVVKNMKENVTIADDYWIDVPLNSANPQAVANRSMVESSFADANSRFCIQNQAPFENLNPHNLYKVRASVVSVENFDGKKGAGLIIADNLILTSADLMVKDRNNFKIKTINGRDFQAGAFRVNPNKNVALLLLEQPTNYSPLPLSLELPEVNKDILMTLGLLDLDKEGEGYLDNEGKVIGYRWSEERGAEIIVDTFVQTVTLGGALIDKNGNIVGIAHDSKKLEDTPDLFIPIETALKSLGLEICGRKFTNKKPAAIKTYETPLADAVDNSKGSKAPQVMKKLERK